MLEDGDMGPEATKGANASPEPSSAETEPKKKDGRANNGGANFKVRSDDKRGGAQPTKEVADESPKTKRGVPKGQKVLTSSDIRAALSRRSGAVDVLVRVLKGEQFQTTGPTGKTITSYPSVSERLSAVRMVLERTCPTLTAVAVDQRVEVNENKELPSDRTLARAVLIALTKERERLGEDAGRVVVVNPNERIVRVSDPTFADSLSGSMPPVEELPVIEDEPDQVPHEEPSRESS